MTIAQGETLGQHPINIPASRRAAANHAGVPRISPQSAPPYRIMNSGTLRVSLITAPRTLSDETSPSGFSPLAALWSITHE